MLPRGAGNVSEKTPCEEMVGTGVGLWPEAVTWESPVGTEQCREQQKEPMAAKGCAATSQQDRRQITAMSLSKWQCVSSGACQGWLPAVLPTAWHCPLHPHLRPPSPSAPGKAQGHIPLLPKRSSQTG